MSKSSDTSDEGGKRTSIMSGQTNSTQKQNSKSSIPQTSSSTLSSIPAGTSASNYDPAIARLKIPKNVITELEKLVAQKQPKKDDNNLISTDKDLPTYGMTLRFITCLFILITLGIITCLLITLIKYKIIIGIIATFISLFLCQWYITHGTGLTRHKRAYFNEKNVLETYKVFDRDYGHLFKPDPDTPGCCGPPPKPNDPTIDNNPVKSVGNDLLAQYKQSPKEKAQFSEGLVQEHYGNMYDNIRRINQELQLLDKANKANQQSGLTYSSSDPGVKFVPVDIPLPGQKSPKNNSSPK